MLIDFHCHIFPKHIRENRSYFFSGEPEFQMLYSSPQSKLIGVDELIKVMDEKKIDISVVFGFPWRNEELFRRHNDYIMESVNRYPERLKGFCTFDIMNQNAFNEAERCIGMGMSGVGELAVYASGISSVCLDRLFPIMSLLKDHALPLLMHTNEPIGHQYPGKAPMTLMDIYNLIRRFSDNTIVLAHFGGGIFFYHLLRREMKEALSNVYFDTAASPFLYDPAVYRHAVDIIGADKILLGSDYPLLPVDRYFSDFQKGGLSCEEIAKITGGNGMRLLGPER